MNVSVRAVSPEETEAVKAFYYAVIEQMQGAKYHPKWQKGIYPDDAYLESATKNGEMFFAECDGNVVGAMMLNHHVTDGYENAAWQVAALPEEVVVIHTLGVLPSVGRQGVGRCMVEAAKGLAKDMGAKVLRLDVLVGNLPADRLYRSCGFAFIERVELFYEDTGLCEFDLFEYRL